ncbi:MAG: DUF6629 family protein [Lutibacter sp.]
MCFSAEASFTGGIIIFSIGIATVKNIQKPSQLVFSIIPLFFGIQQITEGYLWLSLQNPEFSNIQKLTSTIFLIMAEVLWPMIIPLSVLLMEDNKSKKKILRIFLGLGILLAIYYAYCIMNFNVNPKIVGYHIQYNNDFPITFRNLAFAVYLIATITPLFVSSIKKMHYFGILMFLSCLITALFFVQYLTSVWCFFAAFISVLIFWILKDSKKTFSFEMANLLKNN